MDKITTTNNNIYTVVILQAGKVVRLHIPVSRQVDMFSPTVLPDPQA